MHARGHKIKLPPLSQLYKSLSKHSSSLGPCLCQFSTHFTLTLGNLLTDHTLSCHINGILASRFMSKVGKKKTKKHLNGLLKGCKGEVILDLMFHFAFVHKELRSRINLFIRSLSFTREVYIQNSNYRTQGERQ